MPISGTFAELVEGTGCWRSGAKDHTPWKCGDLYRRNDEAFKGAGRRLFYSEMWFGIVNIRAFRMS